MNDNMDFKTWWNKQETATPNIGKLFQQVDQLKKKRLTRLIQMNICLVATAMFIGFVWYYYEPEQITTKIGICLVFLAILVFLFSYNKLFPLFLKPGFELNSKQYLQQLLHIKTKELFIQKTIMSVYFGLLLLGICLYMLEYTSRMEILWAILTYLVVILWIAFNWFYLKPKLVKKQNVAMNNLIARCKKLNKQFENHQAL